MPNRSSKRPTDQNQLAKLMVDITSGDVEDAFVDPNTGKNLAAVALGRKGGLKGGAVRAMRLSSEEKTAIARNAAKARWAKNADK